MSEHAPLDWQPWLLNALEEFRDGNLSDEKLESVRSLLLEKAEARSFYLEFNQVNHHFSELNEDLMPAQKPVQSQKVIHLQSMIYGALLAASVILVPNLIWKTEVGQVGLSEQEAPLAQNDEKPVQVKAAYQAQSEEEDLKEGQEMDFGKSTLKHGVGELELRNGAILVLEAPCSFELLSEEKLILNYGKLWARCAFPVDKFEVYVPSGHRIIDMGTEFGVSVGHDGKAQVHVFEGQVDVTDSSGSKKVASLLEGKALGFEKEDYQDIPFDHQQFTTAEKLAFQRWQEREKEWLESPQLSSYFDFRESSNPLGILKNVGPSSGVDAKVRGTIWGQGRWPGKEALLFEKDEDVLEWPIDEKLSQFTFASWLKFDRFEHPISAIFYTSDNWSRDNFAIHVKRDGTLHAAISARSNAATQQDVIRPGQWYHVVVSWASPQYLAKIYINGERANVLQQDGVHEKDRPGYLNIQRMSIGAWCDNDEGFSLRRDQRNFRGRMDELLIFERVLSEEEIQKLYHFGKP